MRERVKGVSEWLDLVSTSILVPSHSDNAQQETRYEPGPGACCVLY